MKHSKEDLTHIAIILDRTGSMEEIREDTIGGFNAFLKEQQVLTPPHGHQSVVSWNSSGS